MSSLNKFMKTAIICDWLVAVGGAEKFLGHLLDAFPNADVFAVVDFVEPNQRGFLRNKAVKTTFIQNLPFAKKHYRHYLPLMPLAIEQLDLSHYDLILSSSHAVAKGVITGPDQVHISYIHSPMRYAWDLQHHYLNETGLAQKKRGWIVRYFLHKLRAWDFRSAYGVDHLLCNSSFIAKRIQKTYKREATVLYPPIELQQFTPGTRKDNFYLAASRLVPYKKIDLIVEAFKNLPDKHLIVIGDGPDAQKIRDKASPNVTLMGYQPNEVLIDHMQRAKALIFAAEEDFGLIPVEAQACGTPVIAFGKGGALETVQGLNKPNPTGVFFDHQTIESLQTAIHIFETNADKCTPANCTQNAARFNPEQFKASLLSFVQEKIGA